MPEKNRYEFISLCHSTQVEHVYAESLEEACRLFREGGREVELDQDEPYGFEVVAINEGPNEVPMRKWKKLLEETHNVEAD